MRIGGGHAARASRLALFALVCLAPQLVRADFTVTSVLPEIETGARAVDAHDSVAYVVDDGVTAVDVSDESAPRVIASLTDLDLRGCASVAAYAAANGQKRLAVACAGSNALGGGGRERAPGGAARARRRAGRHRAEWDLLGRR
jgi:hypothetical protein